MLGSAELEVAHVEAGRHRSNKDVFAAIVDSMGFFSERYMSLTDKQILQEFDFWALLNLLFDAVWGRKK